MKKGMVIATTLLFLLALGMTSWAASKRCVVVEAEENRLILECKGDTDDFKEGVEVKIKTVKKKAAVEGC